MAQAVTIDAAFLQRVNRPQAFGIAELEQAAMGMTRQAWIVRTQWTALSADQREFLAAWAYRVVNPPRTFPSIATMAIGRLYKAYLVLIGAEHVYLEFGGAVVTLVESILDQVEQENPEYLAMVAEAVAEVSDPTAWTQARGKDERHAAIRGADGP